jgi:hypothetical protein
MMNGPFAELRLQFQLSHWQKARLVPFCEGYREFMQDVGGKEDTRVEHKDLTLAGDSYMSNPLDTVSPLEISLHP